LTPDTTTPVLDAAARFHEEVLHPINQASDAEGARLEDGNVHTPAATGVRGSNTARRAGTG
jgi:hypothetical protein